MGRRAEHRHRLSICSGSVRPAARPRFRAAPAQGGRHCGLAGAISGSGQEGHGTTSIVMIAVGLPVEQGLIASLARPAATSRPVALIVSFTLSGRPQAAIVIPYRLFDGDAYVGVWAF